MLDLKEIAAKHSNDPTSITKEDQMMLQFQAAMPRTLWMNHYELSQTFHNVKATSMEWRKFLKDHDQFITAETAILAETAARKALNNLSTASSQEVSAIKTLLEKSKLINDSQKQQQQVIVTYMPNPTNPTNQTNNTDTEPEDIEELKLYKSYVQFLINKKLQIPSFEWYKKHKGEHE